ncbi:MAG: hypothetical protein QOE90_300 [Thermoplasmata archaeon]|nr:hypothetical protein [Thermoplasmata archaeon]
MLLRPDTFNDHFHPEMRWAVVDVLEAAGFRVRIPAKPLCCRMAGGFGFERTRYAVSPQVGELGILPKARAADAATLLLADGFSCRTQTEHATGRRPLHLAEALQMGLKGGRLNCPIIQLHNWNLAHDRGSRRG